MSASTIKFLMLNPDDDSQYLLHSKEFILNTVPLINEWIRIDDIEFYVVYRRLVIIGNVKYEVGFDASDVWELTLRPQSSFSDLEIKEFEKAGWKKNSQNFC